MRKNDNTPMGTQHKLPDNIPGNTHIGLELFHCERHDCWMTIEACRRRQKAAQKFQEGNRDNPEQFPSSLEECINCKGLKKGLKKMNKTTETKNSTRRTTTCKICGKQGPLHSYGMCNACSLKDRRKKQIILDFRQCPGILEILKASAKAAFRTVPQQAMYYLHLGCGEEANSSPNQNIDNGNNNQVKET
jgi:hypothetical protein